MRSQLAVFSAEHSTQMFRAGNVCYVLTEGSTMMVQDMKVGIYTCMQPALEHNLL